ncbi:MAG: TRAP transporter substrate-binding protein DctP, partial [Bacillota bacterium]
FRHLTNNVRPIRTPADLKGLKMRVMPIEHFKIMIESMGAQATPIPWIELYTSLQTGVVDGQENPICNIIGAKLHEVQKYITLDGHCLWPTGWIMNWNWFKSLKPEHQKAIWMAMDEAKHAHIGIASLGNDIGIDTLKAAGVQIYTPTEKELEAFRRATQGPVIDYLITKKGISKQYIDRFFAEIRKIEEELGY